MTGVQLSIYKAASTTSDIILELRKKVDSLPKGEDFDFTFRAAAALHAILLSKDMTSVPEKNSGWDTDNAIEHAVVSGCGADGSALPWGGRGRWFESSHSDQGSS